MNTLSMLTYEQLREDPRAFSAFTGLTVGEFSQLLPAFQRAYESCYPRHLTVRGGERQRRPGGGRKSVLDGVADRLLFILVYVKAKPPQTIQGLQFGLSQPQANYWIHHLLPVLEMALCPLDRMPGQSSHPKMTGENAQEDGGDFASDDAERILQLAPDIVEQGASGGDHKGMLAEKSLSLLNASIGSRRLRDTRWPRRVSPSSVESRSADPG